VHSIRIGLRASAIVGATALAALATAPAFAADTVAQASAQSLALTIAGHPAVTQTVTASNDGTGQTKGGASTIPTIAGVLPGNNALGVGVAPQDAGANADGTSYACAGIAGTGGGIVHTGSSSCDIDGSPITLDLGTLDLGSLTLDPASALGDALKPLTGTVLDSVIQTLQNSLVAPLTSSLASSPLGTVKLGGTVSVIEASCTATPDAASGTAHVVDTQGGTTPTPITATIGGRTFTVAQLPVDPAPNTHVVTQFDDVAQSVEDAVTVEITNAVDGAAAGLDSVLQPVFAQVQSQVIANLVAQLQPALQPLQQQVLDITLNKQSSSDAGRRIDVTALDLQVLPGAAAFTGSSLVSGQLGHVTCGPNARPTTPSTPQSSASPLGPQHGSGPASDTDNNNDNGGTPLAVDAGLAGETGHGHAALYAGLGGLTLAGVAGALGYYRRFTIR
jgi:hypothetical protein